MQTLIAVHRNIEHPVLAQVVIVLTAIDARHCGPVLTKKQRFLTVFLNHTSLEHLFFVANPPDFKSVVKMNVFIGKFLDQTFNVVGRVRAPTSLEIC